MVINERLNRLDTAFELLIEQLLKSSAWQIQATDDRLIDSVPVMIARGTRANQSTIAPELASTGFCAAKGQHYHGVKLHLIGARRVNQMPLPEKIHLSQASQNDLAALRASCRLDCLQARRCLPTKRIFIEKPNSFSKNKVGFY